MKKFLTLVIALVLCLGALVSCGGEGNNNNASGNESLDAAVEYVSTLYKSAPTEYAASFTRVSAAVIAGERFTVTWTSSSDKVTVTDNGDGTVTVNVPKSDEDFEFVLTATVADAEGNTAKKEYSYKVLKFAVTSYTDYMAAEKDANVVVEGIVTGIVSKTWASYNCIFLQDKAGVGGYYVYGMEKDPIADLKIEIGMTVRVAGVKDIYNGTHEVKSGVAEIISTEKTEVAPIDLTEAYTKAPALNDASLVNFQNALVTVKGVEITGQVAAQGYYNFKLGAHESYVRISGSTCAINKDDQATFIANHTANYGSTADVVGIVSLYNGNFYLVPVTVDAYSNFAMPERNDQEKAEFELNSIKLSTSVSSDTTLAVPFVGAIYSDVTIAWVSNNAAAVVGEGGITVTVPDEKVVVKLTATATCGSATATKEFEITLNKSVTPIKDLIAIGSAKEHNTYTEEKYITAGVITKIENETFGNMHIQDANGDSILVYGLYDAEGKKYGEMGTKPVVGDYIVVIAVVGQYNGTAQLKNATLQSFTTPTSIKDAIAIGGAKEHNTYTEELYVATGVVKEVYNTTFGNLYLKDAEGNEITVYGLYDLAGVRYDKMATQPKAGDTITVYGVLGQYNGTAQFKNATIVCLVAGTSSEGGSTGGNEGGSGSTETTSPIANAVKPVAGTAYKLAMLQGNTNKIYYMLGAMNGYYVDTTETYADGVDYYVEETTGGYYLYYQTGETKTYINFVTEEKDGKTYTNAKLEATATTVYTYDEALKTFKANVNGDDFIIGTNSSKTYTTVGPVKVSYTPFYVQFVTETATLPAAPEGGNGGNTETPTTPSTPELGEPAATIGFADRANRTEFSSDKQVWVQNGITVTNEQASSTSPVADYADPARFYKSSSLKIEYGTAMTKIVFECDDYKTTYATDLKASITDANATVTVSGTTVTVVFTNAVTSFSIATLAAQVRVDTIKVYTA